MKKLDRNSGETQDRQRSTVHQLQIFGGNAGVEDLARVYLEAHAGTELTRRVFSRNAQTGVCMAA